MVARNCAFAWLAASAARRATSLSRRAASASASASRSAALACSSSSASARASSVCCSSSIACDSRSSFWRSSSRAWASSRVFCSASASARAAATSRARASPAVRIVVSTCGTARGITAAVVTDATAVTAFTPPDSQYVGCHSVQTSRKCVIPHATMNKPKATNRTWNGMSRRARCTRLTSASEMTTYDSPISTSAITCVRSNGVFQR